MPPKAGDHAVAVAFVLDLKHHPLIRLVGSVNWFRDDTVKTGTLETAKPVLSNFSVAGRRSKVNRGRSILEHRLQFPPAHFKRFTAKVTIPKAKQIEKHNRCRRLRRQKLHS